MNKTAILSFIIDEVALKCRNVSSNMRKRIHWMLEGKEITVRKYDKRVLILNGWIRVGRGRVKIRETEEIKKGVSNYWLKSQEQVDRVKSLNNEIRCYEFDFNLTEPIEVESIEYLRIDQDNYQISVKSSFNKAKHLSLEKLSTDQIKLILTRFKRITRLQIEDSSLESINFAHFRIKEFHFEDVSFEKPVYLPREINELCLHYCDCSNLIKAQRVDVISFSDYDGTNLEEHSKLAETLEGVKVVIIDEISTDFLTSFPSTVRKIHLEKTSFLEQTLVEIIKKFPYLIDINNPFPIEEISKTKLKAINPIITETEEKFDLRLRRIKVDSENVS